MSSNSIIVHRTYDPIQAEMLGDLLRDGGLAARVLGTRSGAAIGVGQVIMELHITVPQEQAGQAIDFLEAYFEADGADLLRQEGLLSDADVDSDDDDDNTAEKPLSAMFAFGSVLLLFGGGHLYARRGFTTLVIAAGQIIALANIIAGGWQRYIVGMSMMLLLLLFDIAGSQLAVRAFNRGRRPSRLFQLLVGASLVAAAGGVGSFLGPRVPEPKSGPDVTKIVSDVSTNAEHSVGYAAPSLHTLQTPPA